MKPQLFDKYGNSIKHILPNPSERLIDKSKILSQEKRHKIIDIAAKYVNENSFLTLGRSSMCLQFAILINHMLTKEKIESQVVRGYAEYRSSSEKFKWEHYWVETTSGETIDCNIDSIIYHPDSPESIEPFNYWGPTETIPDDRTFSQTKFISDSEIQVIEKEDSETIEWKKQIDFEY